ncbi:9458_t:CDS:2, partial [Cetraspora pellucida]
LFNNSSDIETESEDDVIYNNDISLLIIINIPDSLNNFIDAFSDFLKQDCKANIITLTQNIAHQLGRFFVDPQCLKSDIYGL